MLFSSPLAWHVGIVAAWLGLVAIAAEGLYRFTTVDPEVTRKIVHIGTGPVVLLAWWLQIPAWIAVVASIFAGTFALLSYWFPLLPGVNSIDRQSFGTFFYAVSMGTAVAWFWHLDAPQFAALGILIMSFGDGLAATIGQNFGRHQYFLWGMQKSWEGSGTMFVVSFAVSIAIFAAIGEIGGKIVLLAVVVAAIATILEAFSKKGIDNLTVPLGSATIAFWLHGFLLG